MTHDHKKELLIGGGVIGAGLLVYYLHWRGQQQPASQPASTQAATSGTSVSPQSLLDELSLASGYAPSGAMSANELSGYAAPNFASDLEQSLQTLQSLGLLPNPAQGNSTNSGSNAGAVQSPATPATNPSVAPTVPPGQIFRRGPGGVLEQYQPVGIKARNAV